MALRRQIEGAELRAKLARKIASYVGQREKLITDVPGLLLSRRTAPTAPCSATYGAEAWPWWHRAESGQPSAGTTFIFDESRVPADFARFARDHAT